MDLFNILAILLTLAAVFSYVNFRWIKLPVTIGVMLIALLMSVFLLLLDFAGFEIRPAAHLWLSEIQFSRTLLEGMLSFLLFAGALHVNLDELMEWKWSIGIMATFGVLISTFLIGGATMFISGALGHQMPFLYCLIFGALISPTDPIAVLSILKTANTPKALEMKIAGESLFNDGVGVVIFLVLLETIVGGESMTTGHVLTLFGQEAIGGAIFGLGVGYIAFKMLYSIDNYQIEVMITLALVTGGYALAAALHLSGPIAIVVAGLMVGNQGRRLAMSDVTRHHLDIFWELMDEILNAVLFVLIGLEVIVLTFEVNFLIAGLVMIPIGLIVRFIAVGIPLSILRPFRQFTPGAVQILTWGGIRGGISVALALALPVGPERDLILAMTYIMVIFSISVQGLTIAGLVKRLMAKYGVTN